MMEVSQITEEFLRSIDVHTVLPQQEPFVMIGTLVGFSMTSSITETVVREDCIFVDDGVMSPYGMLENIAQTCAARVGFYNRYILHNEVRTGFIAAVRDYRIHRLPSVGSTIVTTVDIIEEIFGMTLATARICQDGEVIACTQVKLSVREQ